jgi:hypothetical protein
MYVSTRLDRLERALRAGAGQCSVCGPVRSGRGVPTFRVRWNDDDAVSAPQRCPHCGEPLPVIQLTWDHGDDA